MHFGECKFRSDGFENPSPRFDAFIHRNQRTTSGMHSCMQDDQNGPKMMVLASADKTRRTHFILSKNILNSKRPSMAADGTTIMHLPCLTRYFCQFLLRLSPSSYKISMHSLCMYASLCCGRFIDIYGQIPCQSVNKMSLKSKN
jgi:hypothetical protein